MADAYKIDVNKREWFKSCYKIDKEGNYSHYDFQFTGEEYYDIPSIINEEINY